LERITEHDLVIALNAYIATLKNYGLVTPKTIEKIKIAAPYGMVRYVVIYNNELHHFTHSLPGFTGSSGSGFMTKREGYEKLWQTTNTIRDIMRDRTRLATAM